MLKGLCLCGWKVTDDTTCDFFTMEFHNSRENCSWFLDYKPFPLGFVLLGPDDSDSHGWRHHVFRLSICAWMRHPCHFSVHNISASPWGDFFKFGTCLDSKINWLRSRLNVTVTSQNTFLAIAHKFIKMITFYTQMVKGQLHCDIMMFWQKHLEIIKYRGCICAPWLRATATRS